ncbi:IS1182 family transposase [Pelagibius sp. Alg239-R121]|uniref:IS1182 family transposase n=1 Tax=Pelagibius sp. Alg239-R121 TaxID=2993448 RepID=UPI0024A6FA53|nr:IS1182 family transposase [Pelagibius sp. Alg239-R121]
MLGPAQEFQSALFYEFNLEDHVPSNHLLRSVDRFVDLFGIRAFLAPFYSDIGRPSIDPELMIRMLLIGYIMGIRSERRLCDEVHVNLAYRWFCRLDLNDPVPDQSTFSKNRHGRFRESDLFRHLFEIVVDRCIKEGVVGGDIFATDASIIRADANKQNSTPKEEWDTTSLNPEDAPRAVKEYLDTLDDAAFGAASVVQPKFTSHSDPASQWTGAMKGPAFFAYANNYLIDTDNAIIVDVEASRAIRQAEVGATRKMIQRTRSKFGLYPEILAADTAYGTAENLNWLVHEEGILPYIPVFDKSKRKDGTFSSSDFAFNHQANEYTCPAGKPLKKSWRKMKTPRSGVTKEGFIRYYARKMDCEPCPLKPQCTPRDTTRKITRHIYEGARDLARELSQTDAYMDAQRRRKKVEMLFAHLKRIMKLDRLRLRGPNGAKDEFHLAATAQNLRKLAKLIPQPA